MLSQRPLRLIFLFCFLGSIFASALSSISYACTVKNTPDDMIADARQVADTSAANYNGAVLLEVVVDSGNVGGYFLAVCQPDTCDFSQSGVGFFGRLGPYNQADTPPLGRTADI